MSLSAGISRSLIGLRALRMVSASVPTINTGPAIRQYATETAATEKDVKWSTNSIDLVNRMRDQQKYYAKVMIKGRPFTVTKNDIIIMDRIKDLELGDIISLNQVSELGSHDYTIKGQPFVDSSLFSIKATVIEHPDGKLFTVLKKRRRTAHKKTTFHRNHYTMLRVSELDVNKL